ncbi:hypothetical protein KUL97_03040 [Synechococcus sp. HK05]|uniref:hypothetical protein n=1 Tax=Synechococcus sp. HK05 TaxID=2725975 RepID=UPI001C38D956|nr:hypothetical protein [Synechococcus sp. HK05]MBV2350680.1 hypothetical protein [Synechococcus sp. HK05]
MTEFLPTKQTFLRIAKGINLEPTDKAVDQVFDALVLSGHLSPSCRAGGSFVVLTIELCSESPCAVEHCRNE